MSYLFQGDLKYEKVLIWCKYKKEAEYIDYLLSGSEIRSFVITSDTKDKKKYIDLFKHTNKCQVLVATYGTLDQGVDLSVADTAIRYSLTWSPRQMLQSEDRIIHPSKKTPVLYIDLITKNTVDEDIYHAHQERNLKESLFQNIVYKKFLERLK